MAVDVASLKRQHPLQAVIEQFTGQRPIRNKIFAPWRHEDTPSVHIYEDGGFVDYGDQEKSGDVLDFLGYYWFGDAYDRSTHFIDVVTRLGALEIAPLPAAATPAAREESRRERPKLSVNMADIRTWHEMMPDDRRAYWHSRGIMDPTVDKFMLGWDGRRYTIPHLYRGIPFGVKRRRADELEPDSPKYICIKGTTRGIFNSDVLLTADSVTICEGELDCALLDQYEFPAVTSTAGATSWKAEWRRFFDKVRRVNLLLDNDEAGQRGARLIQSSIRRARIVRLPEGIKDVGELFEKHDAPLTWLQEHLS